MKSGNDGDAEDGEGRYEGRGCDLTRSWLWEGCDELVADEGIDAELPADAKAFIEPKKSYGAELSGSANGDCVGYRSCGGKPNGGVEWDCWVGRPDVVTVGR